MRIIRLAVLFVALGLMLATGQVFAQTETGKIAGTVTDPQGLVVPGVSVTLTSGTGARRTTVTDSGGRYVGAGASNNDFGPGFYGTYDNLGRYLFHGPHLSAGRFERETERRTS